MSRTVVVFSPDHIRGNVASRKLKQAGFEALLCNRAAAAIETVSTRTPRVFVFDTVGCIPDERRVVSGFCESLRGGETGIIVLGKDVRELPWLVGREGAVFLPDPLDPDRLAAVAGGMFSGPRKGNVEADSLESDLKDFLRLS